MSGDLTVHASSNASVINADISFSGGTYSMLFTGNSANAVVVNTDRISGASGISSNLIQATTEQFDDAAYLAAQGFPIGVD